MTTDRDALAAALPLIEEALRRKPAGQRSGEAVIEALHVGGLDITRAAPEPTFETFDAADGHKGIRRAAPEPGLTPGRIAAALVDASFIDDDQRQDVITLLTRAAQENR